jgi:CRISPR-associated protein Cmr4
MIQRTYLLHALSALHVGTGQSVGTVDLPIARARATNLPLVPGSGIKGVLRDELKLDHHDLNYLKILFGPQNPTNDTAYAGAIAVGDANLLILPIRSFAGTVAFATCPFILKQYQRDILIQTTSVPTLAKETANVVSESVLILKDNKNKDKIALEDLDLNADISKEAQAWGTHIAKQLYPTDEVWQNEFISRFVILPDDIFSFLAETATEIRMRVSIDRTTRTAQNGNLWSEENLPAESVLWGVMGVSKSRDQNNPKTAEELAKLLPHGEIQLQIGGKHTVGRGLCRLLML